MSETLDLRNLTREQKEKLPMDVRMRLRSRMDTEAMEKARQILAEDSSTKEPNISIEEVNGSAGVENPIRPKKVRKLPPKKKNETSSSKPLPQRPGAQQKVVASQYGSSTTKKKFTIQITERVVREFKIEALKRGLTYSELAERALTNIFINPGDSQPSPEE